MIEIKSKKKCVGCQACEQICPVSCIALRPDEQGFLYPRVDTDKCVECHLCEKVCPVINRFKPGKPVSVYAAFSKNDDIIRQSASGGVFYLLARNVIEEDGVVFGAAYNDNMQVRHVHVQTIEDLSRLQGSKYVQSLTGDTFRIAEGYLKAGKTVLYSGTPCQIAGLKLFLRKDYANLITVDIICHGVPSPLVWQHYLNNTLLPECDRHLREKTVVTTDKTVNIKIRDVNFRTHDASGREVTTIKFISTISDKVIEDKIIIPHKENKYFIGFNRNIYLRPSCYSCPAKSGRSHSDITLGDFWGIRKLHPGFPRGEGVSLVFVNSDRGQSLFGALNDVEVMNSDYRKALKSSLMIKHSVPMHKEVISYFWSHFLKNGEMSVDKALLQRRYPLYIRIGVKVKRILRRLSGAN